MWALPSIFLASIFVILFQYPLNQGAFFGINFYVIPFQLISCEDSNSVNSGVGGGIITCSSDLLAAKHWKAKRNVAMESPVTTSRHTALNVAQVLLDMESTSKIY